MNAHSPGRFMNSIDARHGAAMVVAIVCLLLVTTISFALVKYAVAAHQQTARWGWKLQSAWLADSVLMQTAAQLRDGSNIVDSEWNTGPIGPSQQTGRIHVSLGKPSENARVRSITVVADFPDDPTDRVRTTRTLTWTLPESTPATTN